MEILAVGNFGASVEVVIARSTTRLPTYSPCGCNLAFCIHATVLRGVKQVLALMGTACGSNLALPSIFPAERSLVSCAPRTQAVSAEIRPDASRSLDAQRIKIEIKPSVKLRGWRRGRFLHGLRAAGARFSREGGPVHQAAATRPGPTIRPEEQARIRRWSVHPAPACDAANGPVFRVRRSLTTPIPAN